MNPRWKRPFNFNAQKNSYKCIEAANLSPRYQRKATKKMGLNDVMKKVMELCSPRSAGEPEGLLICTEEKTNENVNVKFEGVPRDLDKTEMLHVEIWTRKTFLNHVDIGTKICVGCTEQGDLTFSFVLRENVKVEEIEKLLEDVEYVRANGTACTPTIIDGKFVNFGKLPTNVTEQYPSIDLEKETAVEEVKKDN